MIEPPGIVALGAPRGRTIGSLRTAREEVPLMKTGIRILAVMVSLIVLATGPLAPLAAAQQPPPPPPPMAPAQQPTPQPADPVQPESRLAESAAYNVGAGIANVFYVPGKGLLCILGGISGIFVMIVSVGSAPKTAAFFAKEGCGGKWVLTGDDLRPDASIKTFDWEREGTY